jgi:hypothetical protein
MSRRSRDIIEGESVQLYTALKPLPNLPVVEPSCSLHESPIRESEVKSWSENVASLYASRDGPW